jgi:hypothetical protein
MVSSTAANDLLISDCAETNYDLKMNEAAKSRFFIGFICLTKLVLGNITEYGAIQLLSFVFFNVLF